ncbi:hypothetical protein PHYBLDRAFT_161655 [Phycomyces blakesleeanus NRRL 1555(-)]|uniref:Uncharacterized protein n=2 Tax=Phycomyces blakesleeanus TaxID=4837 RepID=A0A167R7C8_PHYB8|nr:hypothetical protein PHYBLDRAFT_161655 [Phycomyces blakesleeanus NRRL 1555(-)]OAD81024.1 hypothetical protein PHYBLDRAFT_161655 [Phycomyces blakesleeanus NRRL 1555(-)]|eukprot:XP_018299064.1 hypothetical protein PHYBLDRAFT_161655 [Phycomyces blakesleeanus NRRL 1555(-)]
MRSSRDLRVASLMVSIPVFLVIASLVSITVITVYTHFISWLQAFSTRELSTQAPLPPQPPSAAAAAYTALDTYTLNCLVCPINRHPSLIDLIHATLCRLLSPNIYSFVVPNQAQSFSFFPQLPWMVLSLLSFWIVSPKLQPRYRAACMSFGQWSTRTAEHVSLSISNKVFSSIEYITFLWRKYPALAEARDISSSSDTPMKLIQVKQNDNALVRRKKEKGGRSRTKRSEARSHTSGFREPAGQVDHTIMDTVNPAPFSNLEPPHTADISSSQKTSISDDSEWTLVREKSFRRRTGQSIRCQDPQEEKNAEDKTEMRNMNISSDTKPETHILLCDIPNSVVCKEKEDPSDTFQARFQVDQSDGESTLNDDDDDDETLDRSEYSLLTADNVLILDHYNKPTTTSTSRDLSLMYEDGKTDYLDPPYLSKGQVPEDNNTNGELITEQRWYSPFSTGFNLAQLCDDPQKPWDCPRPPLVRESLGEKPESYFHHWSKNYVWGNPCIGIHPDQKTPSDSLPYQKPFSLPLPEAYSASRSKLNPSLHQYSASPNYLSCLPNRRAISAPSLFSHSSTSISKTTYHKPRHPTQNENTKAHFM